MTLYDILPPLQQFVKVICSMENADGYSPAHPVRVLPDTCVELFINYIDDYTAAFDIPQVTIAGRSFITCRMSNYMDVRNGGKMDCLSVCFYPGKAHVFFQVDMAELSNKVIMLTDLWGQLATEMEEETALGATHKEKVQILQRFLIRLLHKNYTTERSYDFSLTQITGSSGFLPIAEIARRTGISNRQLVRKFNRHMGLSPKEFARMSRFLLSLKVLRNSGCQSLTEVAYESGYFDQAHFIHDCREFSGMTPGELLSGKNILY